jgi:hypothetical protein
LPFESKLACCGWKFFGVPLHDLELMAKGDVLQGELSAGSEGGCKHEKDDFEHPIMLLPGSPNSNDTNADGILGRRNRAGLGHFFRMFLISLWLQPQKKAKAF